MRERVREWEGERRRDREEEGESAFYVTASK
jgi:hypothetical protein